MHKLFAFMLMLTAPLLLADVLPKEMRVYPTPQEVKMGGDKYYLNVLIA